MSTHLYTSKADVAYARIREQILDGTLPAGSKLPQYELADAMGISITPLREAVRRLSSEGWIELVGHRNARVAPMDPEQARELVETRRALEVAAITAAATRRTDSDVAAMRAALERLRPVTRDGGEQALAAHRDLHETIYRASGNGVMIRLLDDIGDKSDRYRRLGLQAEPDEASRALDFDEHHRLVDLVAAGDAPAAADLMTAHIDRSLAATLGP